MDKRKIGRKHTEETKAKLSQMSLGKKKSPIHRNKVALSKGAKPFNVYVGSHTKPIAKFISINQAAQALGGLNPHYIKACLEGDYDSVKGFRFVLEENLMEKRGLSKYLDLDKVAKYIDINHLHLANPVHVEEPEKLVDQIDDKSRYADEFRALVLRLLANYQDIKKVSHLCCVPEQTIYVWLLNWNRKQQKMVVGEESLETSEL